MFQRVDTKNDETVVIIYFEYLAVNKTCVDIKAFRSHNVAEQKPSAVTVYDYYDSCKFLASFLQQANLQEKVNIAAKSIWKHQNNLI